MLNLEKQLRILSLAQALRFSRGRCIGCRRLFKVSSNLWEYFSQISRGPSAQGKIPPTLKGQEQATLVHFGGDYTTQSKMIVDDIFKPDNVAGSAITKNVI